LIDLTGVGLGPFDSGTMFALGAEAIGAVGALFWVLDTA